MTVLATENILRYQRGAGSQYFCGGRSMYALSEHVDISLYVAGWAVQVWLRILGHGMDEGIILDCLGVPNLIIAVFISNGVGRSVSEGLHVSRWPSTADLEEEKGTRS